MDTEDELPDWARALSDTIASTIEFKGMTYLEGRYSAPHETDWGVDLLEMAPSIMEVALPGPYDGERVYGIIGNFDLLATQRAFDEISTLTFQTNDKGRTCITIEGTVSAREVVVIIHFSPFNDAEVNGTIGYHGGK